MGATASGKTDLAMQICDQLPCDIVSVDSAMIYRGMDIGTAKPGAELLADYPHRLIDILDPSESYSAAAFRQDAIAEINQIHAENRIPLLTGGTSLYFHLLKNGLAELPSANPQIRQRLVAEAEVKGWAELHTRLTHIDPESAKRLKPTDSQRLQRALEVYELTGRTLTEHWAEQSNQQPNFSILPFSIQLETRQKLHKLIEKRFELMLKQGLIDEVKLLWQRGDLNLQMPAIRTVGYRQVWMYLSDIFDYSTMQEKAVIATRQLAKRQLTWLRNWEDLHIIEAQEPKRLSNILKIIEENII